MKVKVRVFAGLKDYFAPQLELEMQGDKPCIASIRHELLNMNPDAAALMELCRFAAGNEFVEATYQVQNGEVVSFLPPSSGG